MQLIPQLFSAHAGFRRAFAPSRLTLGFILPLEAYPYGHTPTMRDHVETTRFADDLGFAALWARDVPTYDPSFGDVGQIFDPFTYLAFLASNTKRIALGTGAAVITLRHPIHVAKQSTSVDILSNGRLLLGVASGDRPSEYPLFNLEHDYEQRGERFREAFSMFRLATENQFPVGEFSRFGNFSRDLDLVPKPSTGRIPAIVVGRSRQEISWTAVNADGWFYYYVDLQKTEIIASTWREAIRMAVGPDVFKPFIQGMFFDLLEDPDALVRPIHAGMSAGRNTLIRYLAHLQELGVHHVAFNTKVSRRPVTEVLKKLAEYVLPHFPSIEA